MSIFEEARDIAAYALAAGLISVSQPGPKRSITEEERRAHKRRLRREVMRRYRDRHKRYAVTGIHRLDFPDGEEGLAAYRRAYAQAWHSIPGNHERNVQAIRKWHAQHRGVA